jgi:hypothetical protein
MPSRGTPKIPRFKIIFSMCECSEKSENSHRAKIVNYNAFNEFLQMVPKHNFIGPFKLFLFIGKSFQIKALPNKEKKLKRKRFEKFVLLDHL